MMSYSQVFRVFLTVVVSASVCRAEDIMQRIPKRSLGFVVVRNLDESGRKVEQLLKPFLNSAPNPVVLARVATGLGVGIQTGGDCALAMVPGDAAGGLAPLVILPVADYELFARSIQADESGEVSRVSLLGEDILIGRAGSFALMMNVEQRRALEGLVAQSEASLPYLEELASWLPEQDIAVVVMPAGLIQLSRWQPPRTNRVVVRADGVRQQSSLTRWLSIFENQALRNWLRRYVMVIAAGVTVDEAENVRLSQRVMMRHPANLFETNDSQPEQSSAQFGLSDQPVVFTGSGSFSASLRQSIARYLLKTEKEQAAANGMEKISKELWEKEARTFQLLLQDVSNFSVVMLPGKKGEPLVGNFLGLIAVGNVTEYFNSLAEVVGTWNEMYEQSTSDIKPTFELVRETVAGQARVQLVVDVATAARDPNVPEFNWMLEAAFGPEGKFIAKLWQVDQGQFLFGLATDEQMAAAAERIAAGKAAQPASEDLRETLQLLDPDAPCKMLVQPQGCLIWATRVINEFISIGLTKDSEVDFAPLSDSPPLGISVDNQGRLVNCDLVCPASTWTVLGEYLATLNAPR